MELEPSRLHPLLARASAVIFDMDGVLADTEPVHQRALEASLARFGAGISDSEYRRLVGSSDEATWQWAKDKFGLAESVGQLVREHREALVTEIAENIAANPGVEELLARLRTSGKPLGLASNAGFAVVHAVLEGLGLESSFSVVLSGDEVRDRKPDPTIYLETARRLRVPARSCAALEDSLFGIQAASASGMTVIALRTRYTGGLELPGDLVVNSLLELLTEAQSPGMANPRRRPDEEA